MTDQVGGATAPADTKRGVHVRRKSLRPPDKEMKLLSRLCRIMEDLPVVDRQMALDIAARGDRDTLAARVSLLRRLLNAVDALPADQRENVANYLRGRYELKPPPEPPAPSDDTPSNLPGE